MNGSEVLSIVFIIVLVVLAVVLAVVGVQLFLTLNELKATLRRVNYYLDSLEEKLDAVTYPFRVISSFVAGFGSGGKAMEGFSRWLQKDKEKPTTSTSPASRKK